MEFERGGTQVVPGLAEKWTISPDGRLHVQPAQERKWHSNKNFKPTRNLNADDVVFMLERQWKDNFLQGHEPNHSYFGDMGMAKLLKSVEKVDDYTVRIT